MIQITPVVRLTLRCDKCKIDSLSLVYDAKPSKKTVNKDFGKTAWLCPTCKNK